ncbi:Methionine--tRNA ligase, cytoplasmic [Cardamine amara subsp. amara]|uniref:Methionine--tRNA ligase, cytoplasmic n=1 Tax=Cardamine amara subsp. amara TaxID=228776 RepID=A0ABD1ANJ3_CARAN
MQQLYCDTCKKFLAEQLVEGSCSFEGYHYDSARGDYCENCGNLLSPTELIDTKCKLCKTIPRIRDTDNLFIELSLLRELLEECINETYVAGSWSHTVERKLEILLMSDLQYIERLQGD